MAEMQTEVDPMGLLKGFYSLQEERVQTYAYFEEGFQAYLNGAPNYNFPLYRQLVHEITQGFNKISKDILLIKSQLMEQHNLSSVATIISSIQEAEKHKLELTVKLQLARQKEKDDPEDAITKMEITDLKQRLREALVQICENLDELKYESEDLYEGKNVAEDDSTMTVDR